LTRLTTTRNSEGDLQNLSYTHDPIGNITNIHDESHEIIYYNGEEVTPVSEYEYDAIYRLIEASGREHIGQTTQVDENDPPMQDKLHPNDSMAMRGYLEKYEYDEVGNILQMRHTAAEANWTRYYEYETTNNRLKYTSVPGDDPLGPYSAKYTHDEHGNMTSMPHLAAIEWDYKDRMSSADLGGGGKVYFVYDASGQRVRKVHEHNGSTIEERLYLGGFEVYRKWQGVLQVERETVHVMDDKRRVALVETKTHEDMSSNEPITVIRYQVGNHLSSSCLELDHAGAVISYEEYHPYGTTAYHATSSSTEVSEKRYRNGAKEKDEETALYYHGARYYSPWLGRWCSHDPIELKGGINFYEFVFGNPLLFIDPNGTQALLMLALLSSDSSNTVPTSTVRETEEQQEPDDETKWLRSGAWLDPETKVMTAIRGEIMTVAQAEWQRDQRPLADAAGATAFSGFGAFKYLQAVHFDDSGAVATDPSELGQAAMFGLEAGNFITAFGAVPAKGGVSPQGSLRIGEWSRGYPLEPVTTGAGFGASSVHPDFSTALATHALGPTGKLIPKGGKINVGGEYETPEWSNLNANIGTRVGMEPRFGPGDVQNWVPGYAEELATIFEAGSAVEILASKVPTTIRPESLARGAFTVLAPGGSVMVNYAFADKQFMLEAQSAFVQAGFVNVQIESDVMITGMKPMQ